MLYSLYKMLAQHPLTGKPIRVIKSSAQLWRDAKTLVLLDTSRWSLKDFEAPCVAWSRWETCAVGLKTVTELRDGGTDIHIPLFLDDELSFEELEHQSKQSHLVVVSMKVIERIGKEAFKEGRLRNIVCLEEFIPLYPYCGSTPWDGSVEDAVVLLCMILKYSRIAGISGAPIIRKERLDAMNIHVLPKDSEPAPLWLIQQYYRPDNTKRAREIKKCLEENIRCPFVDKIVLLNEGDYSADYLGNPKIQQKVVGKRLTYEMVIREIYENVPEGVIVVFSNSDIYLNETTKLLWSLSLEDKFLSLLRWDCPADANEPSKMFGPRDDSQDTWVLSSSSVKSRTWKWDDLSFPFGKNGCDNAINVEMLRQKFLISNPAYSIQTQHLHLSGYRTYDPQNIVDKSIYLHVAPTALNDMNARETFDSSMILRKVEHAPFHREIKSVQEKEIKSFIKMISRNEQYPYLYGSQNEWLAVKPDTILGLNDNFITENGLPYGHHELFVGSSSRAKEIWSSTGISGCQPVIETSLLISAPITKKETATQEDFCLKYLAKILQMREINGMNGGEFLCPNNKLFIEVLRLFRWNTGASVPVIEQMPNSSVYSKKSAVWACSDLTEPTREDVLALRSNLNGGLLREAKPGKITIIEDGLLLDMKWTAELEERLGDGSDVNVIWPGRTSVERIAYLLRDTEILIYANTEKISPKLWQWMWMLPETAKCIEVQSEMDPRGDSIHFAGAIGLELWLVIMRKGLAEPMRKDSASLVYKTIDTFKASVPSPFPSPPFPSLLPVIWLPRNNIQGFFGHKGDSFREMVRIWEERGYCTVKEHPVATLCWWDSVGTNGSLLYDRPNLDWFYNAPPLEQSWKMALFGNPNPDPISGKSKVASWSFWPRRPRLVEDIVSKNLHSTTFNERLRTLVFYGKVENRVQEKRRTVFDWGTICDEFVMVKGEDTAYPLTQEEYLLRLTTAKFGLCLAGFGLKCHREVECMAMGCVPVVTEDVDMTHYANPPVKGKHYLRITNPLVLKAELASISPEKWQEMSNACKIWWRENASCDGMFALTQKLLSVVV